MANYDAPFEIHVHGDVPLRADVTYTQLQEALKPLWKYAGAKSLADAAESAYEEEPGIKFDAQERMLSMCWTVAGDVDFRQQLDEMCMSLNDLAEEGAAIEVTFYDAEFDEEEAPPDRLHSRDDARGSGSDSASESDSDTRPGAESDPNNIEIGSSRDQGRDRSFCSPPDLPISRPLCC